MALKYTKKVMDHFLHPKNIGEIKNPDGYAEVGNPVCGDMLTFTIKVKNRKIVDIKYLSFGCASNIATASIMTEKVKGMTIEKAKEFKWETIISDLGGLPKQKIHCSVLVIKGLQKAIEDYETKGGEKTPLRIKTHLSKKL